MNRSDFLKGIPMLAAVGAMFKPKSKPLPDGLRRWSGEYDIGPIELSDTATVQNINFTPDPTGGFMVDPDFADEIRKIVECGARRDIYGRPI